VNWLYSLMLFLQEPAGGGGSAPAGQPAPQGGGGGGVPGCGGQQSMMSIVMIVVMILIFWLLIIRPQQKRQKQHQAMVQALKRGDRIITQGGIYGRIVAMTPSDVTLEVAKVDGKEVRIRVLRANIAGPAASSQDGGGQKDAETVRDAQNKR